MRRWWFVAVGLACLLGGALAARRTRSRTATSGGRVDRGGEGVGIHDLEREPVQPTNEAPSGKTTLTAVARAVGEASMRKGPAILATVGAADLPDEEELPPLTGEQRARSAALREFYATSVDPLARPCFDVLKGQGKIEIQTWFTQDLQGNWMVASDGDMEIVASSLPEESDALALTCLREATREATITTPFRAHPGATQRYVVFMTWNVPRPPVNRANP